MTDQLQFDPSFFLSVGGEMSGSTPSYGSDNTTHLNLFDAQFGLQNVTAAQVAARQIHNSMGSDVGCNPQLLDYQQHSAPGLAEFSSSSPQSSAGIKVSQTSESGYKHEDYESQIVPENGSPSKRAKFLERNRQAAAKCRTKKKEWTNNLEAAARQASQQTRELHAILQELRDELLDCKTKLMDHQGCDCHPIQEYIATEQSKGMDYFSGSSTTRSLSNSSRE